jgi:predicted Na+-dependent transporter
MGSATSQDVVDFANNMHTLTEVLLIALKLAVVTCILGVGMEAEAGDAWFLLRRPALLTRSLLAMYVLVPLVAVALVKATTLPEAVNVALLVLAVSAGAPLLSRKLLGVGDGAFSFSLVLMSSVLAIVLVPAWLALLAPHFSSPPELGPSKIAVILAKSFLIPLAVGVLVRLLLPGVATTWGPRLLGIGGLVLTAGALALLVLHWQLVLQAGWPGVLTLFVLIAAALVIGHLLGGPVAKDRTTLAMACTSRHIGVAVAVATSLAGPRTAVLIACYVLTSAAVSVPYLRWRRHSGGPSTQGAVS